MISNSISIKAISFFLILVMLLSAWTVCALNLDKDYDNYVIEKNDKDLYRLILYSSKNEIVFEKEYLKEPFITREQDDFYKIVASSGVNSNYTVFVDTKIKKVSQAYFNILYQKNRIVAYLKEDTIYVTDVFDDNVIYKEIKRNFSRTAVPQSAIISFDINNKTIFIEYLEGDALILKQEELEFKHRGTA